MRFDQIQELHNRGFSVTAECRETAFRWEKDSISILIRIKDSDVRGSHPQIEPDHVILFNSELKPIVEFPRFDWKVTHLNHESVLAESLLSLLNENGVWRLKSNSDWVLTRSYKRVTLNFQGTTFIGQELRLRNGGNFLLDDIVIPLVGQDWAMTEFGSLPQWPENLESRFD